MSDASPGDGRAARIVATAGCSEMGPGCRAMADAGDTLGVAVVGLGFMGCTHRAAWERAARAGFPVRVAAIHDRSDPTGAAAASRGNLSTGDEGEPAPPGPPPRVAADFEAILDDPAVHIVSLCTPTDSHVALGERVLASGRHLLVEKPVALESASVERLRAAAAARPDLVAMPAMCMRFWPGWTEAIELARGGGHGRLRAASFERLGSRPDWNPTFYGDARRSGGVLFDLHVHDADIVLALAGRPEAVTAMGAGDQFTVLHHFGADGPAECTAAASWAMPPSAGFRMRHRLTFDRGVLDFDIERETASVLHGPAKSAAVPVAGGTGYDGQVRHLAEAVARSRGGETVRPAATLDDAVAVTDLLTAVRRSLETGRRVDLAG